MKKEKRQILDDNWLKVKAKAAKLWKQIKQDPMTWFDKCKDIHTVFYGDELIVVGRLWEYIPKNLPWPTYTMELWLDFEEQPQAFDGKQLTSDEQVNQYKKYLDGVIMDGLSRTGKYLRLMVFDEIVPRCFEYRMKIKHEVNVE